MNANPTEFANDLRNSFHPRNPYEQFLVAQIVWAAAQLQTLMTDAPASPDVKWMRLFALADRTFHRNVRLLEKSQKTSAIEAEAQPAPEIPWADADPQPTKGGLTREMRYLLSESDDPDALIVEWVDRGLLPAVPDDLATIAKRPEAPPRRAVA